MNAITHEDVERLVAEAYPEDDRVEFKQDLSSRRGTSDRSITTGDEISGTARNKLMEEVIAFANAHGGHLILGIEETTERPARAKNIVSIPHCEDLAERIKLQIRDCIDPQLPVAHVKGIPTAPDGQGVVVIRIPQSRSAPHRVQQTLNCCIRRADRCEKMTMREIQDLTLHRDRSLEKIESMFDKQKNEFGNILSPFNSAFGIRCTLIPIGSELYIKNIYNNENLIPFSSAISYSTDSRIHTIGYPYDSPSIRPILRGKQYSINETDYLVKKEIYCNGLIEFSIVSARGESKDMGIPSEFVLGLTGNAMLTAHRFRRTAGAPDCEYGLELEIRRKGGSLFIDFYHNRGTYGRRGVIESNPLVFPKYPMGSSADIPRLIERIRIDMFDAAGINKRSESFTAHITQDYLE